MSFLRILMTGWAVLSTAVLCPVSSCTPDPGPAPVTPGKQDQDNKDNDEGGQQPGPGEPQQPEATGGKTLVVWYSFTGNSKSIANALRSHIAADAFEVQPAEDGLDYAANNYAIGSSLIAAIRKDPSSASSYPAIKDVDPALDGYDTVIIVTPLWWSQMAAPMQSFLFKYGSKMAGKTIGLIVTSASSGISEVEKDAKRLVPQGKFLSESLWIRSSQVRSAASLAAAWYDRMFKTQNEPSSMKVTVTAGGKTFTADIEDSETGKAFLAKLPMTLEMSELNGNEKYCYGVSLPRSDKSYDTIVPGDLMLYSGDCIVLFYGAAGGYSYTRIGKLTDVSSLASSLGKGSVSVKFEKQ
jgi:flavodoxin